MITSSQLSAAVQALNDKFRDLYKAATVPPWLDLATKVTSTTLAEVYEWFGASPEMQEITDEIPIEDILSDAMTVTNKDWGTSIKVSKNLIKDSRLGSITPKLQTLAEAARNWQIPHLQSMILNGAATTVWGACYDGQALFSGSHSEGESGTQDNDLAGTGTTLAQVQADLATVVATMASWKDDKGNRVYGISPDTIVIPPAGALIDRFRALLQGKQAEGTGDYTDIVKRVLINPELTDLTDWYAFCTTRPIGALMYQERQAPTTGEQTMDLWTYIQYGVQARGNFFYGDWRCAVRTTNS